MTEHIQIGVERRREDYGPLTGRSHYVDDLRAAPGCPPALHMMVVRSLYAHAEITSIRPDWFWHALRLPAQWRVTRRQSRSRSADLTG